MKKSLFVMAGAWIYVASAVAWAATIYVPKDYSTIGDAIKAAQSGDEVVVSPGTYGPVSIWKENITVRSTFDGKDWSIVKSTIIKDSSYGGNVFIHSTLGIGSTLRGFTLTKTPKTSYTSSENPVGIHGDGVTANVEYCIIENCHGKNGGAIDGIEGTIKNNIFSTTVPLTFPDNDSSLVASEA